MNFCLNIFFKVTFMLSVSPELLVLLSVNKIPDLHFEYEYRYCNVRCKCKSGENLTKAKNRLNDFFKSGQSTILITQPIGKSTRPSFITRQKILFRRYGQRKRLKHFKHIENEMGRSVKPIQRGEVPIDIDLIFGMGFKRSDYDKYPL